jgi:hypothetical protein
MKNSFKFKLERFVLNLFLILLLQSCYDNDLILNYDNNYPSTYSKWDSTKYKQMKVEFASENPFLVTSITEFGFCGNYDFLFTAPRPVPTTDISKVEARNIVIQFVTQNSKQTGVLNPSDITFSSIDSSRIYGGGLEWVLRAENQKYNSLEVFNSQILFVIINGKMTNCQGNWFPKIYIPSKINVNEEKVKSLLINKKVYLSDIKGRPIPMTITAKSLETAEFTKMICPVQTDDKIKLHVVWQVNIPEVYYVLFLDVMTGETVGSYPTAFS